MGESHPQVRRVVVVGGGVSGLAAAHRLSELNAKDEGARRVEVLLVEASSRLGGTVRTERREGFLLEGGPDSFLSAKPWAAELARELGLADQLIGSNDAERKTYIVLGTRPIPMPDGLMMMVPTRLAPVLQSPLFSWKTKLRFATELFYRPQARSEDESAAQFVARHYGYEVVERLAAPLLAGPVSGRRDHRGGPPQAPAAAGRGPSGLPRRRRARALHS